MNLKGTILGRYAAETGDSFVIINIALVDDGLGGQKYSISEGLHFDGILKMDSSLQSEIAEKQGVTAVYTLSYPKTYMIPPRTVFKRIKDGKYFKTTDMDGNPVPDGTALAMKTTRAETYILPQIDE